MNLTIIVNIKTTIKITLKIAIKIIIKIKITIKITSVNKITYIIAPSLPKDFPAKPNKFYY